MTTKHTPGPWKVSEAIRANIATKNGEISACFTVIESDGFVAGGGVAMAHVKNDADESNANARLIAAAPDLLAALQEALAYNDAVTASDGTGQFSWGPQARAAIAKATNP